MTRPGYAVVYVILLCALGNGGSEGKRWKPQEFLNVGGAFSSSLHEGGKKVEEAWEHCRKELIDRSNGVEDFDLHLVEGGSDMRSSLLTEENIYKATDFLPPQTKQILLDCMRTKTSNIPVSEEKAGSRPLLTKYWTSGLGRHLLAESPDNQIPPATAHPSPSPSHSPSRPPGPAVAPPSDDENPADSPSMETPFGYLLPPNMFAPFPSPPPPPPSPPRQPPPKPLMYAPPHPKHDDYQVQKIVFGVAVAVCAISAFLLICICCYTPRNHKADPKEAQKDDSPLLTLASTDAFAGTQKFAGLENSDKKESSNLPTKPEDSSLAETSSSGGIGKVPAPPLKPPPGAPPPPGPPPPPAPRAPAPPRAAKAPPLPKPMHGKNKSTELGNFSEGGESDPPKPKLKPFFWDKVNAKADQGMVWHQINAGSFQFNEEMIESLFGCANQNNNERKKDSASLEPAVQYIQVIDPRKAQNLSILLRALNVTTEEVIDALKQGNEIPGEIIHTLLRMAPTTEEESKLRLFKGELNQLGPAERFLKVLVDIPFAFKRLESLMFMVTLPEEVSSLKDSFTTLEVACNNLRKSRLFLKLLEAVLKTGNRMNDGTYRGGAQAFRLDTLLKLSDVKGTDGKTTLLHFVVQEIIRSEGVRAVRAEKASHPSMGSVRTEDFHDDTNEDSAAEHYRRLGLRVVSGLSDELEDVKKAAVIEGEGLTATVSKLGQSLLKSKEFLNSEMKSLDEDGEFHRSLESFVEKAEADVTWLLEEEKRIMALVKSTADYFHGTAGKDEGLRLFVVVRDFLIMLDKACKEVQDTTMKSAKASKKESPTVSSPPEIRQPPDNDIHRRLFPTIAERRVDFSDSDDESSSP